jgi:hypothetical protein
MWLRKINSSSGGVLVMTLVFVVMFLVIFISLSGMVSRSYHETVLQAQDELAFQVAEAGLNYARWRLAHDPDNFASEVRTVTDQHAGDLGTYELTFEAPVAGSTVVSITSVGTTAGQPTRQFTVKARYGQPSLARFSSVTNGDVWYGGPISGAVHANGGIRMDGESDSLMTSAQENYACQPLHGCSSPFETKPGIWGSGSKQELWEFPVTAIDYAAITLNLLEMKTAAQGSSTAYGSSGAFGYQVEFFDDNTYTISRVTSLDTNVWSWTAETDWQYTSHDVGTLELIENKSVPSDGVIYAEDMVWVKGDVRDRVTVAAGVFPSTPSTDVDIILNGNISYGSVHDGTRAFAAVAQRHIQIPWSGAPDSMSLDGAYVAQTGSFHRRYYPDCCGAEAHRLKVLLTRYGMVASDGVPVTAWVDAGAVISGFQQGQSSYDSNFIYAPPPYFPSSGTYEFISWQEEQ